MRLAWFGTLYAAAIAVCRRSENDDLRDYVCDHSGYEVNLFSHAPLVIYISYFVTPFEREHLKKIT